MKGFFNLEGPFIGVLNRLFDLFMLNVLTVICCIPIITIGPAITALYYVTLKMVKGEDGYLFRSYFKSFKENFKQGMILGVGVLVFSLIIAVDYHIVSQYEFEGKIIVLILIMVSGMLILMGTVFLFPLLARFENTIKGTLKNSFALFIGQGPRAILIVIYYVAMPIFILCFADYLIPILLMYGIALPAYLSSVSIVKIFEKIQSNTDNNSENDEEM